MGWVFDRVGHVIARYLEKPARATSRSHRAPRALAASLKPGDVLLVEGNNHISGVIKYLTQSTWSHAALYVGPIGGHDRGRRAARADRGGARQRRRSPRRCRNILTSTPASAARSALPRETAQRVCAYAFERIGLDYDVKNIIDLMRYLFPLPVPQRWRRRMIALGSGDPTKTICSALIAQAFESVRYPILPKTTRAESRAARREILDIRHYSLYAPRDFDISPYFAVVKPTIERGFDYTQAALGRPAAAAGRRRGCRPSRADPATLVP